MDVEDFEPYLDAASALAGLPIRPEDRDEVMAAFAVITAQSRFLTEFHLPESIEAAPRFVP
jgi:hypothetical protein